MIQKEVVQFKYTKVNRYFYDMVIHVIVISNANTFTKNETLFQNIMKILPIIYQSTNKMPEKIVSAWFIFKKLQLHHLFTSYLSMMSAETV